MCLAVPGKILEIIGSDPIMKTGRVSFGGTVREINLAFVPDATVGDYILAHAGVALNTIDEEEAGRVFDYLNQIEQAAENEDDRN